MSVLSLVSMLLLFYLFYSAFSDTLQAEKKHESRELTTAAVAMITEFHKLSVQGELAEEEAQSLALHALKSLRSDDGRYYWVNDSQANIIMHPTRPELNGQNLSHEQDESGLYLFQRFAEVARSGGGWVDYYWDKLDGEPEHKVSYVAWFEPWDWVIGTGVYLDEVERKNNRLFVQSIELIVVAFIVMAIASVVWATRSTRLIRNLAIKDPLTGVYSRRYLNETKDSFVSQDQRNRHKKLYAMFLDVDHFKKLNDNYGHKFGDEVLHAIGKTLLEHTRPQDLCVRYGGEEFVILTFSRDLEPVKYLAERLRSEINRLPFVHDINLTTSVGIAMRGSDESINSVLNRADQYLYQAKEAGRDRVVSEPV